MTEPDAPSGELPEEVAWQLQRTDGFLDLRMPERARAEFERIPPPWQTSPEGLRIGLRLASDLKDWPEARRIAGVLRERHPDDVAWWVLLAFAARRAEGLSVAEGILRTARTKFPEVAVIPFNLACYACQQGREDEALAFLAAAVRLDSSYAEMALEDDDLRALWPRIGG